MKLKTFAGLLVTGAIFGYYYYKKNEETKENIDHIENCKKQLVELGYNVEDSCSFNLKENSYLLFYFKNEDKNIEVKYDKENEKIEYIQGE